MHRSARASLGPWVQDHVRVLRSTLQRLARQPIGSLLTCAVVALSLGLPATFYALLENLQSALGTPRLEGAVTVYLEPGTPLERAQALAGELQGWDGVADTTLISADQALRELEAQGALGGALDVLESNPLPHTLVVTPSQPRAETLHELERRLRDLAGVDAVHLDWKWVQRLAAAMDLARRAGIALAAALAIAALLVIGNTIRLDIENRREEVLVARLLGATDAFVRRPFLYTGLLYGLIGALGAWLMVAGVIFWLDAPASRLASLYGSRFTLRFPGGSTLATLILLGVSLGAGGAWMAVATQIRRAGPGQTSGA